MQMEYFIIKVQLPGIKSDYLMAPQPDQLHTPQSQMDLEVWILQTTILGGSTKRGAGEARGDPDELGGGR